MGGVSEQVLQSTHLFDEVVPLLVYHQNATKAVLTAFPH